MTKEMLFLADIYTNWCKSQSLPDYMSADDLRYGRDTKDKLNFYQMNWLETFIDVWDCINQNTQEGAILMEKLTRSKIIGMSDAELKDYIKQGFADVTEHDMIDKELYYREQRRILID